MLIALASVLVALIYNGVQAHNTANQLKQGQANLKLSSRADRFTTFMELHDRIVRADAETNKAAVAYNNARTDPRALGVLNAITPLEGVVFALEGDFLPAGSDRVWARYLACDYQLAEGALSAGAAANSREWTLAGWVPTLARFAAAHAPQTPCPLRPD